MKSQQKGLEMRVMSEQRIHRQVSNGSTELSWPCHCRSQRNWHKQWGRTSWTWCWV